MPNHPNRARAVLHAARNPSPQEIRRVREFLQLTQEQAASTVHRTGRNWRQWENGERRMDAALWELFNLKHQL
jgi:DNA-binding transcriptional regulator YiaG